MFRNIIIAGSTALASSCGGPHTTGVELEEAWSLELPPAFVATGATGAGEDALAWSAQTGEIIEIRNREIARVVDSSLVGSRLYPIAAAVTERGVEGATIPAAQDSIRGEKLAALPIVPIRNAFIQVITDIKSDNRYLIRRDDSGRIIKIQTATVPLGLVSASAAGDLVYGFRWIDANELVVYRISR